MISVDVIHQLTYDIAAKQLTAFPSPAEWNQYAALANMDLFNFYNDERAKMLIKVKSGEALFAPPILSTYVVNEIFMPTTLNSASVQSASLPGDYAYDIAFKTPISGVNSTIRKVDYDKLESYLNNSIDAPTTSKPIYVELSTNLLTYPTLSTPLYFTYYRLPATPVWNYSMVNGVPSYSVTGSVNFEWEMTELNRLTMRILSYMGISIRDTELTQYATQMTNTAS